MNRRLFFKNATALIIGSALAGTLPDNEILLNKPSNLPESKGYSWLAVTAELLQDKEGLEYELSRCIPKGTKLHSIEMGYHLNDFIESISHCKVYYY